MNNCNEEKMSIKVVVAVTCSTLQINIVERDLLTHHFHVTVPRLTAGVLYHYDELHPGVGSIAITRGRSQQLRNTCTCSGRWNRTIGNLYHSILIYLDHYCATCTSGRNSRRGLLGSIT